MCCWMGEEGGVGAGDVSVDFDLLHYLQGHLSALRGQVQEHQITGTINSADRWFANAGASPSERLSERPALWRLSR